MFEINRSSTYPKLHKTSAILHKLILLYYITGVSELKLLNFILTLKRMFNKTAHFEISSVRHFRITKLQDNTLRSNKPFHRNYPLSRDRGATLRLGGGEGWGTISDSILWGTKHFFLLILYNFKNIGGARAPPPPPPIPPAPSLLPTPRSLLSIVYKRT